MRASPTSRSRLAGAALVLVALVLGACTGPAGQARERPADSHFNDIHDSDKPDIDPMAFGKSVYLRNCATCHQPDGRGVPGRFPPLAGSDFLQGNRRAVLAAALFGLSGPITVNDRHYDGVMPSLGHLSDRELAAAVSYVFAAWGNGLEPVTEGEVAALRAELGQTDRAAGQRHPGATEGELTHLGRASPIPLEDIRQVASGDGKRLPEVEFRAAAKLYFERCASCHGATRNGSIGKPLTAEITSAKGTDYLKAMITFSTPKGMPNWGASGEISDIEIEVLADFLQLPPPVPPGFDRAAVQKSWKLLVDPEHRPAAPQHGRRIENFFAVALQAPGGLAIIDGDSKELVTVVDTDDAVEELRVSASGRYLVTVTRSATVDMIDLYLDPPARVATVKAGLEARAVAIAAYPGAQDSVVAAGTYWPPQLVLLDGATLEPIKLVSTRELPADVPHPEARIAAVTASHARPEFIVNIKETGQVVFVDYSDVDDLSIEALPVFRLLDTGGWDSSRRYLFTAADLSNEIAVIDTLGRRLIATPGVARTPNPSGGASFDDPTFGPVQVTSAIGSAGVTFVAADPGGAPASAWQPVRELQGMGGGSLYARSHPNSDNLWVDAPLNPDSSIGQQVAVFDINALDTGFVTLPIARWAGLEAGPGRVVQPEYNAAGDEVWLSVWNGPGEPAAIVVVDDKTRALKAVIKHDALVAPMRKFNVHNSLNAAY
jgi:nitrite reductase (NO-forming)/hydroxylamine reductase